MPRTPLLLRPKEVPGGIDTGEARLWREAKRLKFVVINGLCFIYKMEFFMNKAKRIIFSMLTIFIFVVLLLLSIEMNKLNIIFLLLSCVLFNILAIFVTENFFTKPTDVIATCLSIILMLIPLLLEGQTKIFQYLLF